MHPTLPETMQTARAGWLGTLAKARPADIEAVWPEHAEPMAFEWLRAPQPGLVMVRGRAGGTGNPFNLGELTVTRCALRLADGTVGQSYVQGRDKHHAELAARLDALLQGERRDELLAAVIAPLRQKLEQRRLERSRKAASTKVEFFTMVRGEDPR